MASNSTGSFSIFPPRDTTEFALSVLKEKYGMEFQYLSPWNNSMGDTRRFLASCDSMPGQKILVSVENFRDKNARSVSDNVLACRYVQETEAFLRRCAEDTLGSGQVFYSPSMRVLPSSLPADLSFERFLADSGVLLPATIVLKASDFQTEDQALVLAQLIADSGVSANLNFFAVPDELYGTLDLEQLKIKIAVNDFACFASAVCRNGTVDLSFEEGTK